MKKKMPVPSQVTIQYLINEYDTLVNKLNDNDGTTTATATTQSFTIEQPSTIESYPTTNINENKTTSEFYSYDQNDIVLYENLYIICCVLLYIDTHVSSSLLSVGQRYQVCTTARRTFLLKSRLQEIISIGCHVSDDSLLFPPRLEDNVIVTMHQQHDNIRSSDTICDTFEWRYNTSNVLETNNKALVNMYHPIDLTFDKYDLANEEELLCKMANTPIPPDTTTMSDIQYLIRTEWGA